MQFYRKFLRLLLVPFAFLVVGVVRLIYPWKLVRFGEIWSSRIGHLIGNIECYLSEKESGRHGKAFDIWFPVGGVCNKVVYKKYRKTLHVWPSVFGQLVVKINRLFRGWERYTVSDAQFGRDIYNLWKRPHIGFTEKEEERGQKLLRDLGLPKGARWVCLIVRDGAYLKELTYHDYRNSDISDYIPAALRLTERGYYVIRMGSVVAKKFKVEHPLIIDYSEKRTEFGDLYLGAKCSFCISTGTGFDEIPRVFGRPIVYVNFAPIEYIPTFANGLLIWKHHVRDGKRMTLEEIFACGAGQFTFSHLFEQAGIKLEDNKAQEIADVVIEMHHRGSKRDCHEQESFWDKFPRSISPYNLKPMHGEIKLRIGAEFLKAYS